MSLIRQDYSKVLKFKEFVKEQAHLPETLKNDSSKRYMTKEYLTGVKAKEFYENIVSEPPKLEDKAKKSASPKKVVNKTKKVSNLKEKNLLALAQNNDVKNLKLLIEQKKGCNLNVLDEFGWTPLMCAACSGAEGAVKVLLENQADPLISDKIGNIALKLAKRKNWTNIVNLLENYNSEKSFSHKKKVNKVQEYFFCETCNIKFPSEEKHENSTLHLFNCKLKTPTFYGIPESNKGFQLLLKKGWKKDHGLGPSGSGRKFPVKAVPKKDRSGIGALEKLKKERERAVPGEKFENKKIKAYNKWKDKNFEKNFRLEFSGF